MKKILSIGAVIMLVICFTACKKDAAITTATILNTTKATGIQQGEPIVFSLSTVKDSSSIKWSVSPITNSQITTSGSNAVLTFKQKGSYTVTAAFNGQIASRVITVTDTVYNGSNSSSTTTYNSVALTGDQLTLTPSINDSVNYVYISAITKNSYNCLNNSLAYSLTSGTNSYKINYTGVNVPQGSACTAGQKTSTALTTLYSPADGQYAFSVLVNGITYQGSYVKKGSSYTFTWNYTSGVIFSTLAVSK